MSARLKCWHTCLSAVTGLPSHSSSYRTAAFPGSVASCRLPDGPPSAQSSFARRDHYLRRGDVVHRLERRYPFFIALTSSRASPTPFRLLQPWPRLADLCRLLPVLAESGAFPTLSPRDLAWMSGPLPRWDTECSCSLLPPYRRPSPTGNGSASHKLPPDELLGGRCFRGCSHSLMFKPPSLLAIQVIPTATVFPLGSHGVYIRAEHVSLPPHAPDMLIRPKRAIDGRGLSPHKSYGIVGYSYPLQRTRRVSPALYPGRVLLWQVPFGQPASLHPLRHRLPGVVRGLLRYYRAVRLPRSVRHRRTSLDFPMRPEATAALGGLGISRFPREVSRYVHGVSDRAGLWCTSRNRCTRWGLPLSPTASASRRKVLTRLNTRPARSPVNASTPPLRAAPHDSGPMWVATSHSYDFCIHYTSPV